jgi:hypothetical protein
MSLELLQNPRPQIVTTQSIVRRIQGQVTGRTSFWASFDRTVEGVSSEETGPNTCNRNRKEPR